ncbi:MAG: RNA polymerase sigma factor [Firmicutes bacterium]|nr:RNA polymerase sigma factor [Bacillota bacterium]
MHELSDIQLIEQIQKTQDDQACEELIRRYYGILRQLVKYKVPSHADIDDIVQEILIKVITKIDQLRDPAKFRPWMNRIVHSQIQGYYRTVHSERTHPIVQEGNGLLDTNLITESSEDAILHKLEMSDIYDIIFGFPGDNVMPFLLHHLYDLSYAEIAAATNAKLSTVRGRIARTKSSLDQNMFDTDVPQEVRTRLAAKLSQIATDGSYVIHHLQTDYFQNKLLLDELDPMRIVKTKPTIYFSYTLDNLMIISGLNEERLVCLLKVKSRNAIPILLNRISTAKQFHCIFLSTEHLDYARRYLRFVSEIGSSSFVALPSPNVKPVQPQHIIESSLNDFSRMNCLRQDPKLIDMLDQANREFGPQQQNYRIYAAYAHSTSELCAYALFVQVDNHLWELCRYRSINQADARAAKDCIAAGTRSLACQGFYVANTGVKGNDKLFLEIASALGFQELYRFISGTVILK